MSGISIAVKIAIERCKPTENWELQMTQHHVVKENDSKYLSEDLHMEMYASEKYANYRKEFSFVSSKFQSILDRSL